MSATADPRIATTPPLEAEAQEFADATANPPYLFDLGPERAARRSTRSSPATSPSPTSSRSGSTSPAVQPATCRSGSCARPARAARCR